MATTLEPGGRAAGFMGFFQTALGRNLALGAGIALVLSIMGSIWMWNQKPDYRVLVSNFSDRDGGSMIAALQQMNVPYRFSDGGTAILVPADRVYDARLKLASQGLPKGGNVGFELMENQKLGSSQFLEQVNFQRALEGELARSINSIGVVQSARVHLAIPKPSVFVRERQKPTASVMVNLHPGRVLERQQVMAIVHLVSSSVPELTAPNVTVVDQNGNLLSDPEQAANAAANRLDPAQVKYVSDLQDGIVKRIESILTPVVGAGNVRAEATAEVDFSRSEQAAESYRPNGTPDAAAIRSQHSSENTSAEAAKAAGLVGAASNQPGAQGAPASLPAATGGATNTQKENTTNYELDKTVRYVQQPMAGIKRLTVAVVVNHKRVLDDKGATTMRPLTEDEKKEISNLVKEAMGFNAERGDSLNVLNSLFAETPREAVPEPTFWQSYGTLDNARTAVQYLVSAAVLAYLYFGMLRPMIKRLSGEQAAGKAAEKAAPAKPGEEEPPPEVQAAAAGKRAAEAEAEAEEAPKARTTYQDNLQTARQMALQEPKMVANVIKDWVNGNE